MPVGLNNQGNTCYMNSALQLMVNSHFIKKCIMGQNGPYAKALQEVIKARRPMTPSRIKMLMGQKHHRFAGFAQQDSHEFISLCLAHLEDEEVQKNKCYQTVEYDDLVPEQGYQRFKTYCEQVQSTSYQDVLRFYKILVTSCPQCKAISGYSFHEEESLILTIRSSTQQMMANSQSGYQYSYYQNWNLTGGYATREALTIHQLLQSYFKPQIIDKNCSKCGEALQCASYLWTVPKQLIVVFSRFSGQMQKISDVIKYDLNLDLSQYFHPDSPYRQQTDFLLNAISLHSGNCGGGHYTAYVIDENGKHWDCNDSWVQPCAVNFADPRAYVLSYRINVMHSLEDSIDDNEDNSKKEDLPCQEEDDKQAGMTGESAAEAKDEQVVFEVFKGGSYII